MQYNNWGAKFLSKLGAIHKGSKSSEKGKGTQIDGSATAQSEKKLDNTSEPPYAILKAMLKPQENIIAMLKYDLDNHLQFTDGIIVITNQRLFCKQSSSSAYNDFQLKPGLRPRLQDKSKTPYLDLYDSKELVARWYFTKGQLKKARIFYELLLKELNNNQPIPTATTSQTTTPLLMEEQSIMEEEELVKAKTSALFRLGRFVKPYRIPLSVAFIFSIVATAAKLVPPYLTMPLLDKVLIPYQNGQELNTQLMVFYLCCLLSAVSISWLVSWVATYIIARVSERIACDLRTTTYEHLLSLSQSYFGEKRTGDLIARIGSQSDTISVFISSHLLDFATDVLMLCMIIPILISIDPWLAFVTLVPIPLLVWMIYFIRVRLRMRYNRIYSVWAEVTNVLTDTIPGVRVVKAFGQEKREAQRFRKANQRNLIENDKMNKVWSVFSPTVDLVTEIGILLVWCFGIFQVVHNTIQVGVLVAFVSYLSRFYARIQSMTKITSITQKSASASRRIFAILDHQATVSEPVNPAPLNKVQGLIEIKNVHFSYGYNEVYKGFNLTIQPGEMIGIVGRSGAGKSTLINLICRLYDVHHGSICLDGIDIREYSTSEYRSKIGLVSQEPYLFFGTIAENLSYGRPDASYAEIIEAARQAHAHDFIMSLPQGYDSIIGERGQRLSAGQCQRLTIARALLINPAILIFDEATSSLDSHTEHEIQKALNNLTKGRTTIAIAHRLSTLRHANRIIVIENGQIIEEGDHLALMNHKGAYYKAYNVQLSQETDLIE